MKGPYRFKRKMNIDERTGGVYMILNSPHTGQYDYVVVEESDDLRKDLSSSFLRKTWKQECRKMYYAYLCTDCETEGMGEIDAKLHRIKIEESLRIKYEADKKESAAAHTEMHHLEIEEDTDASSA